MRRLVLQVSRDYLVRTTGGEFSGTARANAGWCPLQRVGGRSLTIDVSPESRDTGLSDMPVAKHSDYNLVRGCNACCVLNLQQVFARRKGCIYVVDLGFLALFRDRPGRE